MGRSSHRDGCRLRCRVGGGSVLTVELHERISAQLRARLAAGRESPTANSTATTDPEALAALDAVTIDGAPGEAPDVSFDTPSGIGSTAATVVTEGDGETVAADNLVTVDYAVYSGDDGTTIISSWDAGHRT